MSKIILEYSSNSDKSAKIFIESNGNRISLGEAVLPKEIHEMKAYSERKLNPQRYVREGLRYNHVESFEELGTYYIKGNNAIPFPIVSKKTQEENTNLGYEGAITVSEKAMKTLVKASEISPLILEATRQMFIFGVKKAQRFKSADKTLYEEFIDYGIQAYKDERIRLEKETIARENEVVEKRTIKSNNINPTNFNLNSPKRKTSQPIVDQNKNAFLDDSNRRNIASSNNTNNNTNNISPIDVMLMTAFPDLAPIYRPDSALAWMLYFNNQNNKEMLLNNEVESIRCVKGFEGVQSSKVTENPDGSYRVELFADKDRLERLGSLSCDKNQNLIIEDFSGNKTDVSPSESRGGFVATTTSSSGATSSLEVTPDKNGTLVGNWSIEGKNMPEVSSSLSFSDDLSPKEVQVGQTINLDSISSNSSVNNTMSDSSSNLFSKEVKIESDSSFDYSQKFVPEEPSNKYESTYVPPPPPPPPPPPSDDYNFTTSDPYSKGSSFSM